MNQENLSDPDTLIQRMLEWGPQTASTLAGGSPGQRVAGMLRRWEKWGVPGRPDLKVGEFEKDRYGRLWSLVPVDPPVLDPVSVPPHWVVEGNRHLYVVAGVVVGVVRASSTGESAHEFSTDLANGQADSLDIAKRCVEVSA